MRRIYHLTTPSAWAARPGEPYAVPSLATEGFIHCSNATQVAWAANRFLPAVPEVLVLVIDADRLTSPLKDEKADVGESFPHIYGPINRDAVTEVRPLARDGAGRWTFTE